ncbi:hypothetical protein IT575_08455 [bacterium]|nr:hypothetical protein [bacterium]
MRITSLAFALLPACLLALSSIAQAYERPNAVSLSGKGWQVAPTAPLIDVVENRDDRCDWPTLDPALEEVIPAELMTGDTAPVLAKYMNRGIIALQWQPIAVPCAWEQVLGIDYNQAGWYRKTIVAGLDPLVGASLDSPVGAAEMRPASNGNDMGRISAAPTKRTWIEFDAVSTVAGVWLNGQWLGGNVGDYVRWRVEATDAIRPGENELIVYVDELPDHLTQGFLSMICPHHGGIWQDVRMYETGAVTIKPDGIKINADPDGTIEIEIQYEGDQPESVRPSIKWCERFPRDLDTIMRLSPDTRFLITNSQPGLIQLRTQIEASQIQLWTGSNPVVFRAWIALEADWTAEFNPADYFKFRPDRVVQDFAFRSIETSGSQFLLNGEPLYIRSALNWGYYPRIVAPCPPPDVVREEFRQLKAAGFNAETVCLVNMPDYFYDLADEMGVLIWQEYPSWHCTFAEKDRASYERLYERFMARDRNHPSIILRSMSVEAGVEDQSVMDTLYAMGKSMTDTPIQDNNSWFSHSNIATTDWYGEDNYFNNPQWERHLMGRLPRQLDALPAKPYLIGESILFNTWPDTEALISVINPPSYEELMRGVDPKFRGSVRFALPGPVGPVSMDQPSTYSAIAPQGGWPYWFPRCMDSVLETEAKLRARYNAGLPEGEDIIRDYLLPQSYDYAMQSRRFQMELMHADPRYAGYTVNCIRDMPLIRAGLLDDLDRPRWTPEQWAWHGDHTDSPVHVGDYDPAERKPGEPGRLDRKHSEASGSAAPLNCNVMAGGYTQLEGLLPSWVTPLPLTSDEVLTLNPNKRPPRTLGADNAVEVVLTSVLTHDLVGFLARGGAVVLLASKWPGGFNTVSHMHWRDAVLVPPVGPIGDDSKAPQGFEPLTCLQVLRLQSYDLIRDYSQVVPVDELGITHEVDPLIRLFDTHDLDNVITFDQVFATHVVGDASDSSKTGLLIVSSLDHSGAAGGWLLGELIRFAAKDHHGVRLLGNGQYADVPADVEYNLKVSRFPATNMSPERLHEFAVKRANGILGLDEGWHFRLDPQQEGEAAGWMLPLSGADSDATAAQLEAAGWEPHKLPAWWEQWGISYDGMAWYRTTVDAPADWNDATIRLICDGVDDGYVVWINGQRVALHGSFTDHEATVFQKQTVTDITQYLKPGEANTIALQVVDIVGNGGVWRPVYITAD